MGGPIDRSKLRKVDPAEIIKFADEVVAMAHAGNFHKNEINAQVLGDKFKLTLPKVERVFIQAQKKGLKDYDLIYPETSSAKPKKTTMNGQTGIIISLKKIDIINLDLPEGKKFEVGNEFEVSHDGETITLKRIS